MDEESRLVRLIVSGDDDAWLRFVESYSPFLEKIIDRYVQDDELRRTLFVTLLAKLKKTKLQRFSGKSSLKTWLFIVTKNHCRDYFRSRNGSFITAQEFVNPCHQTTIGIVYFYRVVEPVQVNAFFRPLLQRVFEVFQLAGYVFLCMRALEVDREMQLVAVGQGNMSLPVIIDFIDVRAAGRIGYSVYIIISSLQCLSKTVAGK